jgi:sulfate permease, SulP family
MSVVSEWVPASRWLRGYRREWLSSDAIAGLTTAAVVIPQAMAYATIAGLPVQSGLYCALVPMLVYVILGTSRPLSVSTSSTVSLLTAGALASVGGNAASQLQAAATLALVAGTILFVCGLLRLGFLADLIAPQVLVGFKIGMGLLIASDQLGKVLGIPVSGSDFFEKVGSAIEHLGDTSLTTLALATVTVVVLVLVKRYLPRVPGPLLVLVLGIAAVGVFDLSDHGVALIPPVPSGFPPLALPGLDGLDRLVGHGAGIALMAFVESISAARTFRAPKDTPIDANQELRALGLAAAAGSCAGAYAVSGGLSQTAVNDQAGARSQAAQLVTFGVVVLTLLVLAPVFDDLAEATLGGIVMVAAAGLVDLPALRRLIRLSWRDWSVAVVPLLGVLLFGTLQGVLMGVALSLILLLVTLNTPSLLTIGWRPDGTLGEIGHNLPDPVRPGLLILRVSVPIYYANTRGSVDRILRLVDQVEPLPQVVVIDMVTQEKLGDAVVTALVELAHELDDRGISLWLATMPIDAEHALHRNDRWTHLDGVVPVHATSEHAVARFAEAHGG